MKGFKAVFLIGCLTVSPLALAPFSHAQVPQESSQPLKTMDDVRALLKKRKLKNMMEALETIAAKHPGFDGPTHLHPKVKFILKKTYYPHYLESLDTLHHGKAFVVVTFISGKGDQTQFSHPLDPTNIFLSGVKSDNGPDGPINEEIWGNLTPRQMMTALEFPAVKQTGVVIQASNINSSGLKTSQSLSERHLSIEAKDELGVWVYTLDMPIASDTHKITFTTKDFTETYMIDGMSTDAVRSITINKKKLFEKPALIKISDKLREEFDL